MKRAISLFFGVTLSILFTALSAQAHDVKDPVCRMMVDSDTARYKHKLGNKTFYFCSDRCRASFIQSPEKYVKLAEQLEKEDLHEYTVYLETSHPAIAGQPVEMTLAIRYADTKQLVRDFELVHERQLHLLMTSEDLAWFEHQHPVRGLDGLFRLTWRFPRPGRYRLYADFTPADGDNQVKPMLLTVGGGPAESVPLKPDRVRTKRVGDYRIDLQVRPESLRMDKAALLTYTIRDRDGRLIRTMQPFIGAMGHLIAISQDGKEVVHTHVIQGAAQPPAEEGALRVTPEMATEKGPAFTFKLTLPTAGIYKTWAQFMHNNHVVTVPFTFQVEEIWGPQSTGAVRVSPPGKAWQTAGVQRATVLIEEREYRPAVVAVKAGRPVELTFIRKERTGCGDVVRFPSLGLERTLQPGERAVVRFTPKKTGIIPFTCGMSMYHGQIVVK